MKSATRALFLCPEIEMYSPKISEELIPVLYRRAKDRGIPMTRLVNELLGTALGHEFKSGEAPDSEESETRPARVQEAASDSNRESSQAGTC